MNVQSIKNFFISKNKKSGSGKIKAFFSQLSRGLMIPIAILPIAGLLLGIGGAIGANVKSDTGQVFANIFKGMSDVVFANLPLLFCIAITITFSKDKGAAGFMSALAFLVFSSSQLAFIQIENNNVVSIMWFHKEITGITTKTLGMTTLQTSIFGGIIVGGLTSLIYNYFSTKKLPAALDFFSGIRLVPFILIPAMFLLSTIFLIFWPWIGWLIFQIGKGIQQAPYGTGGLLYGMLGRSLMPFGLHHIPIVMAFQTEFGGVLDGGELKTVLDKANIAAGSEVYNELLNSWKAITGNDTFENGKIVGDQNIWNFINSVSLNKIGETPIFEWFAKEAGVYAGRFTQDYPTYLGACIGIGAAMIVTSEKENRKKVASIVGSSMVVAFLTGITEPLEFSFLFCAPLLYYLLYVPISGLSYMLMEVVGAHVGVGFARGFIDLIIYGAVPVAKGTNFWWAFILAACEGALMFGSFWFFIKKFNLATPGRNGNPMTLISKKEYNEMKTGGKSENQDDKVLEIIDYLGNLDNLAEVSACATRLRVTVKNIDLVQKDNFQKTGSKGIILKGNGIQIIYGGEAALLADKINDILQKENN